MKQYYMLFIEVEIKEQKECMVHMTRDRLFFCALNGKRQTTDPKQMPISCRPCETLKGISTCIPLYERMYFFST